mmetsp:Transcript_11179/g.14616  ORF Transcript_11179/g.14616 Transcript_11179/m.14616 type:complete len:89 (+) Transcript_11179:27-293(+)
MHKIFEAPPLHITFKRKILFDINKTDSLQKVFFQQNQEMLVFSWIPSSVSAAETLVSKLAVSLNRSSASPSSSVTFSADIVVRDEHFG